MTKLFLDTLFTKADSDDGEKLIINGMANAATIDRVGDIIPGGAWDLKNYLKNPIILAYHDHSKPIGVAIEVTPSDRGLEIKAEISKAAGEVYTLIKDGVLKAFSVGFLIKDAAYDRETDTFTIKHAELLETSVVSVPCNQDSVFTLAKAFNNAEEFAAFKSQYATQDKASKENAGSADAQRHEEGTTMTPEQLQEIIATATAKALKESEEARVAKEKQIAEEAAKAAEAITNQHNIEKAFQEMETRLKASHDIDIKKVTEGFEAILKEKAAEITALAEQKALFQDRGRGNTAEYQDIEKAVILAAILGKKSVTETKFAGKLVEKYGAHVASGEWEQTVSTTMMEDIRRALRVQPLFRSIVMPTPVMYLPLNPEAGYGTWVAATSYGTTASSGSAVTHALQELTLQSYKLATKEFITNEEEEDAILALMPIIRDAIVRRVAKSIDKALLRGAGAGADPIKGLTMYEAATANVQVATTAAVSVANLRSLRRNLGTRGIDPAGVTFIVSNDVYYDLLEDTNFMTLDKVGDRATLLTGQIGYVSGSPVILSGEFAAKAGGTAGSIGAVAVDSSNFIVGNQRSMKMESDYLVEQQQKLLVATTRLAFKQITTADGQGVSALRWT